MAPEKKRGSGAKGKSAGKKAAPKAQPKAEPKAAAAPDAEPKAEPKAAAALKAQPKAEPKAAGTRLPARRVVRPGEPFTPGDRAALDVILDAHGRDPSALLAILQDVQEVTNYLPRTWLEQVARSLGLPETRVFRMATFFRAFSLEPRGKHVCTVCMGTACHVRGAPRLVEKIERDFSIQAGGTTPDMNFTLETVNCVGACALGPLVILDGEYHGNITSARLDRVLKSVREGG